jgi:uncharacterized membrane protein (DUF2068 family)
MAVLSHSERAENGAREDRPRRGTFGVYVIVVLLVLNVFSFLVDAVRVEVGLPSQALVEVEGLEGLEPTAIRLVAAAALLVVAVGLWLLKRWAWIATMLATGAGLLHAIVMYWQGTPDYSVMLINVLIVFYLNQRAVQRIFERRGQDGAPA